MAEMEWTTSELADLGRARLEAIRARVSRQAHYPSKADDPTCDWCVEKFLLDEVDRLRTALREKV